MREEQDFSVHGLKPDFAHAAQLPRRGRGKGSTRICLRLNDDEAARLSRMSAGMTVSAFVRERVFGEDGGRRKAKDRRPVASDVELAKALALLGQSRIANNLNQLAHHANAGTLIPDDEIIAKIDEAYAHVVEMRETLLAALGRVVDTRS